MSIAIVCVNTSEIQNTKFEFHHYKNPFISPRSGKTAPGSPTEMAVQITTNIKNSDNKENRIMYIDGQWTAARSEAVFDVLNPATNEKIGEVPDGGREDAAVLAKKLVFDS